MSGFWVGADPGGKRRFGMAFLEDDSGDWSFKLVSSVDEAVEAISRMGAPLGVGIDSPMWWSSGEASRRKADEWIRRYYGIHPGTVQAPNSLSGSALVGGMMLASRIREAFPEADPPIRITESHPKALMRALELREHVEIRSFDIPRCGSEHERDAAVAAMCAREGFSGRWTIDLIEKERYPSEQDPLKYWLAPVHYYWPEPRDASDESADNGRNEL